MEKPPKPYETFPLFPHARGYWCKKIAGRQESFGSWEWPDKAAYERSWKAALRAFGEAAEARARGETDRITPETLTMGILVNAYLTRQEDRVPGEITARTFGECRGACTHFRDFVGRNVLVRDLEESPETVGQYRHSIDGGADGKLRWFAFRRRMAILSGMFRWAEDPVEGALGRPFRLRTLLKGPSDLVRRREKRVKEGSVGKQRWAPDELAALFAHAEGLRAMFGLGYFAGFGNSDCADVPAMAFNFRPAAELGLPEGWGVLTWQRPKTEIERAAVLPASLVADLQAAIAARPAPAAGTPAGLAFLTTFGVPWVRDIIHRDGAGQILKTINCDSVSQEFRRLRNRLAKCEAHGWFASALVKRGQGHRSDRAGTGRAERRPAPPATCPTCGAKLAPMRRLGFYAFRHTAITFASGVVGTDAMALFEGHVIAGVRKHYVEEIDAAELLKIARRLAEKLAAGRT